MRDYFGFSNLDYAHTSEYDCVPRCNSNYTLKDVVRDAVEDPYWKDIRGRFSRQSNEYKPPLIAALMEADIRREHSKELSMNLPSIDSVMAHVSEGLPPTWEESYVLLSLYRKIHKEKAVTGVKSFRDAEEDVEVGAAIDYNTAMHMVGHITKEMRSNPDVFLDEELCVLEGQEGSADKHDFVASLRRKRKKEQDLLISLERKRKKEQRLKDIEEEKNRRKQAEADRKEELLRCMEEVEKIRERTIEASRAGWFRIRKSRQDLLDFGIDNVGTTLRICAVEITKDSEYSLRYSALSALRRWRDSKIDHPENQKLIASLENEVRDKVILFEAELEKNIEKEYRSQYVHPTPFT